VLIGPLAGAAIFGCPSWLRRLARPAAVAGVPAMAFLALVGAPQVGEVDTPPHPPPAAAHEATSTVGTVSGHHQSASVPLRKSAPAPQPAPAPQQAAPDGDAATWESHPEVDVTAPAGTHVSVRQDDQSPGEPVICLSGDLAEFCLDAPVEPGRSGAAAAAAAAATRAAGR
jgi:hypothetical protein